MILSSVRTFDGSKKTWSGRYGTIEKSEDKFLLKYEPDSCIMLKKLKKHSLISDEGDERMLFLFKGGNGYAYIRDKCRDIAEQYYL